MSNIKVDLQQVEKLALDFTSYSQLQERPVLLASLAKCYHEVFSEPGTWEESYSEEEVLHKLERELEGYAALRLYVHAGSNDVIAFCWAQYLANEAIADAIFSVHYVKNAESSLDRKQLLRLVGESSVIYLQDLGVKKMYRGSIPLEELIHPVLENVAKRARTRQLFFWSVSATCVSWLACKVGIGMVERKNDMCFFRGELPSLTTIRRLTA